MPQANRCERGPSAHSPPVARRAEHPPQTGSSGQPSPMPLSRVEVRVSAGLALQLTPVGWLRCSQGAVCARTAARGALAPEPRCVRLAVAQVSVVASAMSKPPVSSRTRMIPVGGPHDSGEQTCHAGDRQADPIGQGVRQQRMRQPSNQHPDDGAVPESAAQPLGIVTTGRLGAVVLCASCNSSITKLNTCFERRSVSSIQNQRPR